MGHISLQQIWAAATCSQLTSFCISSTAQLGLNLASAPQRIVNLCHCEWQRDHSNETSKRTAARCRVALAMCHKGRPAEMEAGCCCSSGQVELDGRSIDVMSRSSVLMLALSTHSQTRASRRAKRTADFHS